jgi:hypothetical protein
MIQRLINFWVYGGFLAAFLLLGLLPFIAKTWDLALLLIFLQLPAYMLHQLEEHDDDRFRHFVNQILGNGREILSRTAVFVINVPGVWGVNLLSILLAGYVDVGFGLIGIYLTFVNALVHLAQAIRLRIYNPGLITALVIFLPLGGFALWRFRHIAFSYHLLGAGIALLIHLLIVAYVWRTFKKIRKSDEC